MSKLVSSALSSEYIYIKTIQMKQKITFNRNSVLTVIYNILYCNSDMPSKLYHLPNPAFPQ